MTYACENIEYEKNYKTEWVERSMSEVGINILICIGAIIAGAILAIVVDKYI